MNMIPAWAVQVAARHHGRVFAYHGGIEYHPNKVPGMRICPKCRTAAPAAAPDVVRSQGGSQ